MDKISSILPSNSRIKTVDLQEAHAARAGSPATQLGQARAFTSSERAELKDRVSFSAASKEKLWNDINAILRPEEKEGTAPAVATQPVQAGGMSAQQTPQAAAPIVNETLQDLSGTSLNKYA